jgi:hypothetical protein
MGLTRQAKAPNLPCLNAWDRAKQAFDALLELAWFTEDADSGLEHAYSQPRGPRLLPNGVAKCPHPRPEEVHIGDVVPNQVFSYLTTTSVANALI